MPIIVRITDAGLAAAIAASGSGLSLQITHIALGGTDFAPTGAEVALPDIREVTTIGPGSVSGAAQFTATGTFPILTTGSSYTAKSVGIYAGVPGSGGILFAAASEVGNAISLRQVGGSTYTGAFTILLSALPADSVTVVIDPLAPAVATFLAAHVALADPHPQYSTPVGAMMPFPWGTPPAGWLEMNGQLVSRATYPLLWAKIEAESAAVSEAAWPAGNWGFFSTGDGSTTFRMPDARGEFFRNADRGRGTDPGRGLLTWQDDAFRAHTHSLNPQIALEDGGSGGVGGTTSGTASVIGPTGVTGSVETRPRNLSHLWCMFTGSSLSATGPAPAASPAPIPAPSPAPVGPPPASPAPPAPPPGAPVADFAWGVGSVGSLVVNFYDSSTNTPTSWYWDFGDGTAGSILQNPSHSYAYHGGFTVQLTATNASGSSSTTKYVYIVPGYSP